MKPGTICLTPKGILMEVVATTYDEAIMQKLTDRDAILHLDFYRYRFQDLLEIPPELSVLIK